MKLYWVEGLIAPKGAAGRGKNGVTKPFSESVWANSPQEAIQMTLQSNPGIRWVEGPSVSETSEEQRMRAIGAPRLPGIE
jgi:hypothetical protein